MQVPANSGIYKLKNEAFGTVLDHRGDTDGVIGHEPHDGNNQRVILETDRGADG